MFAFLFFLFYFLPLREFIIPLITRLQSRSQVNSLLYQAEELYQTIEHSETHHHIYKGLWNLSFHQLVVIYSP